MRNIIRQELKTDTMIAWMRQVFPLLAERARPKKIIRPIATGVLDY